MRKILSFAEQAFTVIALLNYTGGPLAVIISGGASEGDGSAGTSGTDFALIQLLFLLTYGVTFLLLALRWKKTLYVLSKDRFIGVLVGLAVFSIFWSDAPAVTQARTIALIGTTLFGLYLATRYSMREQLRLLCWTFGIAIVLSFAFAVALPKFGIMGGIHAGKWRGIYTHKNVLGKMMVLSGMVFLLTAIGAQKRRWLLWCGFSLSVALLLLSTSSSSLVNLLTLIVAFFIFRALRLRYEVMIPTLIAIAIVGGLLSLWSAGISETVLGSFGKDTTLSGRTDMWPYVLDKIWERPWLGYGYSAFWRGLNGASSYVWYAVRWQPPNSHNGLLDLWLDVGLLGVAIALVGFCTSLVRAIAWVRLSTTSENFWPLICTTYLVITNSTESSLMVQNSIFWVLYAAIVFSTLLPPERQAKAFTYTPKPMLVMPSNYSKS